MKGSLISVKTKGEIVMVTYPTGKSRKSYAVVPTENIEMPPVAVESFAQDQGVYFQLLARAEEYILKKNSQ